MLPLKSPVRRFSPTETKEAILKSAKERPLICATIFAKTKKDFIKTAREGADLGCDIAELRIDHLKERNLSQIKEMIDGSPVPLIITNRSQKDGGLSPLSKEQERLLLIESCLDLSPAFVDIEFNLPKAKRSKIIQESKKKDVGVICSHHDFKSTPPLGRILGQSESMFKTGADIVKLVYTPTNASDASRILEAASFIGRKKKMFTIFGMGAIGQATRLNTLLLGSCLIYCSVKRSNNRLGQIGVPQARKYLDSFSSEYGQTSG